MSSRGLEGVESAPALPAGWTDDESEQAQSPATRGCGRFRWRVGFVLGVMRSLACEGAAQHSAVGASTVQGCSRRGDWGGS